MEVRLEQPLKTSDSMLVSPVKYFSSLNEVMVVFWNTLVPERFSEVTAAASV